jgi:O-antigen/teichoic acid export membrane protein
VRSTLGMTMSAAITGMMPSFARQFAGPAADSHRLVGYSLKYMCLAIAAVATVMGLAAEWIIGILFGAEFAAAVRPLEILAWAQVLVAVDAVLQQALLAAGQAYATVRHAAVGVTAQLVLILILALTSVLDLPGIALAVLLSAAVTLVMDLRYLVKHVAAIPVRRFVAGPLAATAVVAAAMFVADGHALAARVLVAVLAWAAVTMLFGLLPRDELKFMARLVALPGIGRGPRPRAE